MELRAGAFSSSDRRIVRRVESAFGKAGRILLPSHAVFAEAEWKAVYQVMTRRPPAATPSLGDMVRWIAQLGGYLNRKSDGPPGPKTMWVGVQRTRDFAIAWSAINNPRPPRKRCV